VRSAWYWFVGLYAAYSLLALYLDKVLRRTLYSAGIRCWWLN
jgi:hypothetical protein